MTVGVMAAIYFFILRPVLDTTSKTVESISGPIREAQEQAREAQEQLQEDTKNGDNGSATDLNKLQRCVQKAGQNVNALQACANKFGP